MSTTALDLAQFISAVEEELELDPGTIGPDTPVAEGDVFDSLAVVELLVFVEDLGVYVEEEDFGALVTLADVHRYYHSRWVCEAPAPNVAAR